MKNAIRFLGIIALTAIIGFTVTACGGGGGGGSPAPGKLTINNIGGPAGFTPNEFVAGRTNTQDADFFFIANTTVPQSLADMKGAKVTGSSIVLNVFRILVDEDNNIVESSPFTGNSTVAIYNLEIYQFLVETPGEDAEPSKWFVNTVPIVFTNGNATINLGMQMELIDD